MESPNFPKWWCRPIKDLTTNVKVSDFVPTMHGKVKNNLPPLTGGMTVSEWEAAKKAAEAKSAAKIAKAAEFKAAKAAAKA